MGACFKHAPIRYGSVPHSPYCSPLLLPASPTASPPRNVLLIRSSFAARGGHHPSHSSFIFPLIINLKQLIHFVWFLAHSARHQQHYAFAPCKLTLLRQVLYQTWFGFAKIPAIYIYSNPSFSLIRTSSVRLFDLRTTAAILSILNALLSFAQLVHCTSNKPTLMLHNTFTTQLTTQHGYSKAKWVNDKTILA